MVSTYLLKMIDVSMVSRDGMKRQSAQEVVAAGRPITIDSTHVRRLSSITKNFVSLTNNSSTQSCQFSVNSQCKRKTGQSVYICWTSFSRNTAMITWWGTGKVLIILFMRRSNVNSAARSSGSSVIGSMLSACWPDPGGDTGDRLPAKRIVRRTPSSMHSLSTDRWQFCNTEHNLRQPCLWNDCAKQAPY